jgi:large subunit ribosomal protein L23
MDYTDIIIKPILSEKITVLSEQAKAQYAFQVHKKANKHMIKMAIKEMFHVIPEKVRIIVQYGKWKRVRKDYGLTPNIKKALVTLKRGEKIDLFEKK